MPSDGEYSAITGTERPEGSHGNPAITSDRIDSPVVSLVSRELSRIVDKIEIVVQGVILFVHKTDIR